ncbi:serine protease inhibitor 28Dc-like isoform X2 [Topomyia yanbarensis]|uniref:serine protease inhibitor 28Dc-like isoform X2 n=1 Tax=Topomyia yanbarensis TaxID=2498891 RepID=UPI00273B813D|nr:serine protease inhibitor 28Dc-like isoform X2 [Topomyia yanbarensis]
MKLKYTLGIILLVISQHAYCQRSQPDGSSEPSNSNSLDVVANSVTNLAQKISRAIVSQRSKTEIFSPVSIAGALSLLLLGSGGTTRSELMDLMGFSSEQINFTDIHKGFGKLFRELVSNDPSVKANVPWRENDKCNNIDYEDDDFMSSRGSFHSSAKGSRPRRDAETQSDDDENSHEIHIANGIFLDDEFNLNPLYDMTAKELYRSEVEKLDFVTKPDESTKRINVWVNESTHGKIPEIFPTPVGSNTVMVIASALYFKALWKDMFIEGGTRSRDFFPNGKNDSSIKVDMMAHGGCFPFYESTDLDARILGIPYEKNLSTMYIIKPNHSSRQVLQELVAKLDGTTINEMIDKMKMKTAIVLFPKMHISKTLDLKKVLKSLGVRSPFQQARSELSGISGDSKAMASSVESSASPEVSNQFRPAVNLPHYSRFKNKTTPANPNQLVFSRNDIDKSTTPTEMPTTLDTNMIDEEEVPTTTGASKAAKLSNKSLRLRRDVSYKTPTEVKGKPAPLSSKDFFLNKRIVKPTGGKKLRRSRRTTQNLYVSDAVHKVDLEINERGTEGGAATAISLNRSGTSVVFKANEPFLLIIRNDKTKLPIFFGSVYDPRD